MSRLGFIAADVKMKDFNMAAPVISNSLDYLAKYGILSYDANSYLFDKPSQALAQIPAQFNQPMQGDIFNNNPVSQTPKEKNGWKVFGNIVIATIAATAVIMGVKASKLELVARITKPIKSFSEHIFKKGPGV